jgi:hypothetical protein
LRSLRLGFLPEAVRAAAWSSGFIDFAVLMPE